MKKDTQLSQLGREAANSVRTVNLPIHRASTVLFESVAEQRDIQRRWDADEQVPTYGIINMPGVLALENAVAEMEGGYRALTFPSGLAAVDGALLSCVKAGDHADADSCYFPADVLPSSSCRAMA